MLYCIEDQSKRCSCSQEGYLVGEINREYNSNEIWSVENRTAHGVVGALRKGT